MDTLGKKKMDSDVVVITKTNLPLECVACKGELRNNRFDYNWIKKLSELWDIACWNCGKEYRYYVRSSIWSWYEPKPDPPQVQLIEDLYPTIWIKVKNFFRRKRK